MKTLINGSDEGGIVHPGDVHVDLAARRRSQQRADKLREDLARRVAHIASDYQKTIDSLPEGAVKRSAQAW